MCCFVHVSLQTGPIPLQYLVKPTRKRRRPSQSAAQGHSDGVNTSQTSESDSQSDKLHSPAQPPCAPSQSGPASCKASPAVQSSNGAPSAAATPNNAQRHALASKQVIGNRKVTVNGTGAGKEEARGGEKSGLPPTT